MSYLYATARSGSRTVNVATLRGAHWGPFHRFDAVGGQNSLMKKPIHQGTIAQCSALEPLAFELANTGQRSRSRLSIMPASSAKAFPVKVMGVVDARNQLIVTAPATPEGGLIAVHKGQILICRWVNALELDALTHLLERISTSEAATA